MKTSDTVHFACARTATSSAPTTAASRPTPSATASTTAATSLTKHNAHVRRKAKICSGKFQVSLFGKAFVMNGSTIHKLDGSDIRYSND